MYNMPQLQVAACIKIYGIFRSGSKVLCCSLRVIVASRKEDCKDNTTFRYQDLNEYESSYALHKNQTVLKVSLPLACMHISSQKIVYISFYYQHYKHLGDMFLGILLKNDIHIVFMTRINSKILNSKLVSMHRMMCKESLPLVI